MFSSVCTVNSFVYVILEPGNQALFLVAWWRDLVLSNEIKLNVASPGHLRGSVLKLRLIALCFRGSILYMVSFFDFKL